MPQDLRTYLDLIRKHLPEEIYRIRREVDPAFEATAILARLEDRTKYPAVFFDKIKGSKIPLLINSLASYRRLALSLGATEEEVVREWADRESHPLPLKEVKDGPVKEVKLLGKDVDLGLLPILTHNELDAGPYLTAAVALVKDPETGRQNAGIYRHQLQGKAQLGFMINPAHHANYILLKYAEMGKPTDVALVLGHHPAFVMAAVSKLAGLGGEMEVAGGLLREPLEVVRGETVDLLVPAWAEIVIEGKVPPGRTQKEGPFGEWPWYYGRERQSAFIEVTAITMRRDAIFLDVNSGHPEHNIMGALPRMGSLYRRVKDVVPGTRSVNLPLSGGGRAFCYVSMKKRADGEPKQAAFAVFSTETDIKYVFVVDDDINVFNETEVLWAVATRFEADRDLTVMPYCLGAHLNPTAYDYTRLKQGTMQTKLIFDATKPAPPAEFPPRTKVPDEVKARVNPDEYLEPFN
ncbi:MAG: UbiD family decarboxylase [Deltaproteobacteria bacterium]|nr:UbiD family decarboxylase [Deltaproteobacteria bacterium]